jgi:propanol-preferring alcohol dehydrogenase
MRGAAIGRSVGGELIVVDPNWGDGVCCQCHDGNEQLRRAGQLAGRSVIIYG